VDFADGFFRAFLLFGAFILKEAVTAKSAQGRVCARGPNALLLDEIPEM
jgi:hypothetical protein